MAKKARTVRASVPPPGKQVRVIAVQSFEGHGYGHEFEMGKGAKLTKLIADKMVRIDDRMSPAKAEEPEAPALPEEPQT